MSDFLEEVRRQATMGLGRDRQDVGEFQEIVGDQEVELLRVTYASPRLLAVSVFCSGDPQAVVSQDDSPRVTLYAGTSRGSIRLTLLTEVSRLQNAVDIAAQNERITGGTLYPPQIYANGQAANGENGNLRVFTPTAPIQIPAQSLRVTIQKPIKLASLNVPRVYAMAICAPVYSDVSEMYLGRMLEIMARNAGEL